MILRLPENGWSLFGLARSLEWQHKRDEAAPVEARFQKLWSKADVQITASCLLPAGELAGKNSQRIERPLEQQLRQLRQKGRLLNTTDYYSQLRRRRSYCWSRSEEVACAVHRSIQSFVTRKLSSRRE
jgi:hypothetical protein